MYTVSAAYKSAIKKPAIRSRVVGSIAGEAFGDEKILGGSLSITNQNSGNDNVQIGTVYIGQLSVTLRDLTVERYKMDGMEIVPYFQLLLEDGVTWESVPLGRFYVGEANHTAAGVAIKAYDVMSKLDRKCSIVATSGTPYQLARLACESCNVRLATDQETFTSFANGSEVLSLWQDGTDIETWRDFISWVAQAAACYVTADRYGGVVFRPYTQNVVDTVDPDGRFKGASYSDYETRYTGLYCTNLEDNTMDYYGLAQDDGLTYSLGGNPFLQYGTDEGKSVIRRAVLNKLALIDYVPFSVMLPENPAYDLGDVLSFPGGLGDADKLFCINKFTWTYHKGIRIEGVGQNPALATAQSKTDKNISGLASKLNNDTMHYYNLVNAEDIEVHNGETREFINLRYVTTKDTHVDFHAELRMLIDALEEIDGDDYTEHEVTGVVTYYLNDELIAYNPIFMEYDGIRLGHLLYFWQSSANVIGYFRAEITVTGGDLTIPAGHLHAYWAGEGLVGEVLDTNPTFTDTVDPLVLGDLFDFTDLLDSASKQTPAAGSLSETLQALTFSTVLASYTDDVQTFSGITVTPYLSAAYLSAVTVPVDGNYWSASEDGQYIETVDLSGVTGFHSYTGGALSYQCSFDGGTSWKGWNGSDWEDDLEMTYSTANALTASEFAGHDIVRFKVIFDAGERTSGFTVIGGH